MHEKKKPGRKPSRGPATVTAPTPPPTPELLALQALTAEQLLKLYQHLQAWVLERRQVLPPLARLGTAAGLSRAQAQVLLTGTGNRTARTAERFYALQQVLKPHQYEHPPLMFL
jgi:hypothetical protein